MHLKTSFVLTQQYLCNALATIDNLEEFRNYTPSVKVNMITLETNAIKYVSWEWLRNYILSSVVKWPILVLGCNQCLFYFL